MTLRSLGGSFVHMWHCKRGYDISGLAEKAALALLAAE